jgi:hypothetical protein
MRGNDSDGGRLPAFLFPTDRNIFIRQVVDDLQFLSDGAPPSSEVLGLHPFTASCGKYSPSGVRAPFVGSSGSEHSCNFRADAEVEDFVACLAIVMAQHFPLICTQ